jgi:hypothetical protein
MKSKILATVLVALAATASQGAYLGKNSHGIDMYSIDLDLPAEQRFVEVSSAYKD